jgi:hypothetical protein
MRSQIKFIRFRRLLFILALLLVSALCHAYTIDGIDYSITSDSTVSVARNYDFCGSLSIPCSVNLNGKTYAVTGIDNEAFRSCTELISVEIPNSVTTIGGLAFEHCSGLTSIEIPNSVTTIGWSAFSHCEGLLSLIIGKSVTSIDNTAFSGCSGLTSIEIPNSVTTIGEGAFYLCI